LYSALIAGKPTTKVLSMAMLYPGIPQFYLLACVFSPLTE